MFSADLQDVRVVTERPSLGQPEHLHNELQQVFARVQRCETTNTPLRLGGHFFEMTASLRTFGPLVSGYSSVAS
jgi:hypothetical protein